jgi:hypothetical protein
MGLQPERSKENTKKVKVGAAEGLGLVPQVPTIAHLPAGAAHHLGALILAHPALHIRDSLRETEIGRRENIQKMMNLKCKKMVRE